MGRGQLIDAVREAAGYLGGSRADFDPLVEQAHRASFVLLGEATHGSHELYRERARITQRLISELGFNAVVVEADWPDADRANRWAQGRSDDGDAAEALSGFRRFPTWMWRNTVVVDFLGWLRARNENSRSAPVLFQGMDLYSLYASIDAVLAYLDKRDPEAAARAQRRYSCFETREEDGQGYGRATRLGLSRSCENEALEQLVELQKRAAGSLDPELFSAEQNARVARNAEAYYRAMFGSQISTWNLRDRHMTETVEAVYHHLMARDGYARIAVWAHNSHLGDARATQMGWEGELNVGQLLREKHGDAALLVGFSTYDGTVTAADDWGGVAQRMRVQPALPESIEALFHEVGLPRFLLPLRGAGEALAELRDPMLERAIGVVYRPRTERYSHYFEARLLLQFDMIVHIDRTRAVEPLERTSTWREPEPPETYPSAL
jgi:erythromycin esterase-like protein